MSLREKQVAALERMLNFNETQKSDQNVSWKVLVFDKPGRDIISSVLKVNDLFRNGVTVHLLLSSDRYPLSDVPAIYFVMPTPENISIIGKDVASGLYQSWSINFITPLSRPLLEDLVAKTLHASSRIDHVFDQFLSFCVLDSSIFSLEMPHIYSDLANPKASEEQIEAAVSSVVNSLFCVLLTNGTVPIIRANRGNAAEMIAQRLDEKLRAHLANTRGTPPGGASFSEGPRPVLILIDRNTDLISMFSHSWTYQSLVNDACDFRRNRVTVRSADNTTNVYDIDPTDSFWKQNMRLPFPEVADNLDAAASKYKLDAQKLTGKTDISDLEPSAAHLKSALSALPELTERKKVIDMHMNIATHLLKAIGDRGLAQLFEAEETASKQTKQAISELIQNKEFVNAEDKLRLYIVYYIANPNLPPAEQQELEVLLKEQGCDLSALNYVKRTNEISKLSLAAHSNSAAQPTSHSDDLFKRVSGITSKLTERLNQGTSLGGSLGSVVSGLKNFLPANKDLAITKITQSILDPTANNALADDYLWFDPKGSRGSLTKRPKRVGHEEAIIFMVGGGNYYEYANVQDWASTNGKKVTYGSTEMMPPSKFLSECAQLGNAI